MRWLRTILVLSGARTVVLESDLEPVGTRWADLKPLVRPEEGCLTDHDRAQHVDDVFTEPGTTLGAARWFLLNSLFGDLRRPCNRTLMFVER